MEPIFNNQVAWITGAASGIGRAISLRLAQEGAQVVAIDNNIEALAALHGEFGFNTALCNVADRASVDALADQLPELLREPQILVNAAGVFVVENLDGHGEESWQRVIDINLNGPFHTTCTVLPGMLSRQYGRIINITSGSALRLSPGAAAYGSSKAGLIALTKTTALEGATAGVTANAVAPGIVETPMTYEMAGGLEALKEMAISSNIANPLGRLLQPEDIAHAVAFLADPRSAVITGQTLLVNGGSIMSP